MPKSKFTIGQIVDFDLQAFPQYKASGPYKVTRVLPAEDARPQRYTIKSTTEAFERNANEYEIVAADEAKT
jgi:hypothetical protein